MTAIRRPELTLALLLAAGICGCSHGAGKTEPAQEKTPVTGYENGLYRGFDRNEYPGDDTMAALHKTFAFTGYWLTNPPGDDTNTWTGKRSTLRAQGWGFLVLADGRLDAEILKSQKQGLSAAELGRRDAEAAAIAARHEGFPAQTILFLDQEEGGGLLTEQAAYLLAWTEAISASGFRAGVYASGQPVDAGGGKTITTIEDIRGRIERGKLHAVAFFDAQDACPPAPGCTLHPKPLAASGEIEMSAGGPLVVWQYAQSPQRKEITKACTATYTATNGSQEGNCYAPGFKDVFLDMDAASSADPSHGR
jgi:hypothetical protein